MDMARTASGIGLENSFLTAGLSFVALGMGGLGLLGLLSGDFAYQWQPVSKFLPFRDLFARFSGLTLFVLSIALLFRQSARTSLGALAICLALWTVALNGTAALARPAAFGGWLGIAEIGSIALALVVTWGAMAGEPIARIWRWYGLGPIVFGVSHFLYPAITASLVPTWIPSPWFWAYATGALHIAGGLSVLLAWRARIGAAALGLMYVSWAVLLHAPRVIHSPGNRVEWTMAFLACAIAGGAFFIAAVANARQAGNQGLAATTTA